MFARFDENPVMIIQDIKKKTLRTDGRTDARTHTRTLTRTHGQRETVYPPQTKFAGGIIKHSIENKNHQLPYTQHQWPDQLFSGQHTDTTKYKQNETLIEMELNYMNSSLSEKGG